MGMANVQARKEALVEKILENSVYMPDSRVYLRLREQLLRMSKDDLGCLELVIGIKVADAEDKVSEPR